MAGINPAKDRRGSDFAEIFGTGFSPHEKLIIRFKYYDA